MVNEELKRLREERKSLEEERNLKIEIEKERQKIEDLKPKSTWSRFVDYIFNLIERK